MRCILTDDQLEVIFVEAHEDIGQIEEPMECLQKEPNKKARGVPDSSPTKLRSSNPTMNFPSERGKAPTMVKPLITWRST